MRRLHCSLRARRWQRGLRRAARGAARAADLPHGKRRGPCLRHRDRSRRPARDRRSAASNFEIRDDGKPQPLTQFDNSPQPIRLIVMLDVSGSMEGNLPLLRSATVELFKRLLPDDVARLGTFGHEVTISPAFTRNSEELLARAAGGDHAQRADAAVARARRMRSTRSARATRRARSFSC